MSQFRHDVMPEEDVAHVIDHTVHLHLKDSRRTALGWEYPAIGDGDIETGGIFAYLPPLAETNATLRRSLDVTTRLTAPAGTGGR